VLVFLAEEMWLPWLVVGTQYLTSLEITFDCSYFFSSSNAALKFEKLSPTYLQLGAMHQFSGLESFL